MHTNSSWPADVPSALVRVPVAAQGDAAVAGSQREAGLSGASHERPCALARAGAGAGCHPVNAPPAHPHVGALCAAAPAGRWHAAGAAGGAHAGVVRGGRRQENGWT
eukprot:100324-Chlamydomonas_euryale.AAC.1